ncbi:hypothetical protein [uncultured Jatrophihabitans sp.]|uniref:DUF6197 family protein n=1 Tax=uncultured Jatrophihabitans sp. TaxID=1610747 RepID=UPI0035C986D9
MRDDLSLVEHLSSVIRRPGLIARLRLRRRDRVSAGLASTHAALGVLREASLLVELTWARAGSCTACSRDRVGHGGATGSGLCLVGALGVATDGDPALRARVVDLVWLQLHSGQPRRTANWNSRAAREALQVRDLRAWNDGPAHDAGQVAALLRATLRSTRSTFGRARAAADLAGPPDSV